MRFCKLNATDPLLGLSSCQVEHISKSIEQLSINEVKFVDVLKKDRERLMKQLGVTPKEQAFRNQAVKLNYHSQEVHDFVEQLYQDNVIDGQESEHLLVAKVARHVSAKINYKSDLSGEDHWQTVAETVSLSTGDCEDIAILLTNALSNIFHYRLGHSKAAVSQQFSLSAGYLTVFDNAQAHHSFAKWVAKDANETASYFIWMGLNKRRC